MNGPNSLKNGNNMGYYTNFSLRMIGNDDDINEVVASASKLEQGENYEPFVDGIKELVTEEELYAKWYHFEEDFIPFAQKFPNVLFIVYGSGEEEMDIWELRIKGDFTEYHEVEMPHFTTPELLLENEK